MPRRLPPLPPSATWNKHFPARYLPLSPDRNLIRKSQGRTLLANPALCDTFVRSLKLREGEVVIESYGGVGALTRSLISGGDSVGEASRWKAERKGQAEKSESESEKKVASKTAKDKKKSFPIWIDDLVDRKPTEEPPAPEDANLVKPKLVVASEGSLEILTRGLDYPTPTSPRSLGSHEDYAAINPALGSATWDKPVPLHPSAHAPNLLLSHSTSYVWPTLPNLLSHPLVSEQLPVYDPTLPPGPETTKRPWGAPEPPITLVAQLPDSSIGEQLAAQWIGSAVGDEGQQRTWMWEWGRIRVALLCGKSLYDRILAKPGDMINCKLSILAQALFDIVPLPPYHHVSNVDKQSKFVVDRPAKRSSSSPKSSVAPVGIPEPSPSSADLLDRPVHGQRTLTYPLDFYPPPGGRRTAKPLDRPELLGLMLVPKVRSPILSSQKDAWDYVMRRLFVRDTIQLKDAIPNLAFGAITLLDRIAEDAPTKWRGVPVSPLRTIRNLEVDEWLRIVDVFDKWAFKPENLILDSGGPDENIRELGQD